MQGPGSRPPSPPPVTHLAARLPGFTGWDKLRADVKVNVPDLNAQHIANLKQSQQQEFNPVTGQPSLQQVIDAGNAPGATPDQQNKRDNAQRLQANMLKYQSEQRDSLAGVHGRVQHELNTIIPPLEERKTSIYYELRNLVDPNNKDRLEAKHIESLEAERDRAVQRAKDFYSDPANKDALKNAYGIPNDAEFTNIVNTRFKSIEDGYNKQIEETKKFYEELRKNYLTEASKAERDVFTRRVYGREGGPQKEIGDNECFIGSLEDIDAMNKFLDNKHVFTTGEKGLFFDFERGFYTETHFLKTPKGSLLMNTIDINETSIEAILDELQRQGKNEISVNFRGKKGAFDEFFERELDDKILNKIWKNKAALIQKAAARRGMKVNISPAECDEFTEKMGRELERYKQEQTMINEKIATLEKQQVQRSISPELLAILHKHNQDIDQLQQKVDGLTKDFLTAANAAPPVTEAELKQKFDALKDARDDLAVLLTRDFSSINALRRAFRFDDLSNEQQRTFLDTQTSSLGAINKALETQEKSDNAVKAIVDARKTVPNASAFWQNASDTLDDQRTVDVRQKDAAKFEDRIQAQNEATLQANERREIKQAPRQTP